MRPLARSLALAGAAIGATLLLAELVIRLLMPQPLLHDPDAYIHDALLGGRLKPGFEDRVVTTEFASDWKINAHGHRGPSRDERERTGHVIAAVGDSFTFGYGVEEEQSWPRRLESLLANGTQVLNLGVGGYGTWQEIIDLERRWDAIAPSFVVLAFYPGNDPSDNSRGRRAEAALTATARGHDAAGGPLSFERLKRWLGSRLHLYSLVSSRADELLVKTGLRQVVYPFEMEILLKESPGHVTEAWEATREAVSRLAALARRHRVRALVVIVPMKHQVSASLRERAEGFYARIAPGSAGRFDFDRPQGIMKAMCEENDLPVLDLRRGLMEASGGDASDLYWPRDQHFNARGQDVAARLIAAWITGHGWIDSEIIDTGSR